MRLTRWALAVVVNLGAIGLALGAAELYARHLEAERLSGAEQRGLAMCRADQRTIWRYKPGVDLVSKTDEYEMRIVTNDAGLRGGPIPAGEQTVLFIGDSFTFGWGVSDRDRFSDVVGRSLPSARIINAGHWMFTFDQQLVLLKEMIQTYKPKVVVQGFFWMHVRTLFNHQQIYRSRKLVAVTDDKIRVDERGELRFRSDWLERPPLNSQLIALAARQWLNRELGERTKDWVDYVRPGAGAEGLWSLTEALILETADMLKEQGVAYVPFLVPAGLEIDPSMWGNIGWTEPTPPADADPRIPARRFEAIFAKAGRKVLLPHDELRRQGGVSLYFRRDGHWNAEGHRVIGEFLTPYVKTALEAP